MKIKMIATDMDGTLLGDDHMLLPDVNINAFRAAHEKGIINVISSGRTYRIADKEIEEMGCIDYVVLSNGASVMDVKTGEVLYNNYLKKEDLKRIVEIMEKYPTVYEVYAGKHAFVSEFSRKNYLKAALPDEFLEDYVTRFEVTDDMQKIVQEYDIEKINVDFIEEQYWNAIVADLEKAGDFEFTAGFVGNIEITAKNADKGTGLAILCKKLGVAPGKVVAFGDSGNDVTMLSWAGISYAMKNGNDQAKAAAEYETELTNGEGGVGVEINKLLGQK